MKGLRITLGWLLGLASLFLILNGLLIVARTMGVVQGSEFSVLITMVNITASIAVWMGLFALWSIIPVGELKGDEQ